MVEIGRKVKILYTAKLQNRVVLDSSDNHEGAPLEFVIGAGEVIPGLDKAVRDMIAYEKRQVTIVPKDAYGEYDESLIELLPVSSFPSANDLPIGEYIVLNLSNEQVRAKVASVENGMITLDFNHEHAGKTLIFDIELVEIFGETGSAIENELHTENCGCGCKKLKKQLTAV